MILLHKHQKLQTNLQNNISQEKDYDNGPKNLANFFNGEIIDLNE